MPYLISRFSDCRYMKITDRHFDTRFSGKGKTKNKNMQYFFCIKYEFSL